MPRSLSISLAALALLVGAFLIWRALAASAKSPDAPDGTHWVCTACSGTFTLSLADVGKFYRAHETGSPPCPKCKSGKTERAILCKSCRQAIADPGRGESGSRAKAPACPKCGKAAR